MVLTLKVPPPGAASTLSSEGLGGLGLPEASRRLGTRTDGWASTQILGM